MNLKFNMLSPLSPSFLFKSIYKLKWFYYHSDPCIMKMGILFFIPFTMPLPSLVLLRGSNPLETRIYRSGKSQSAPLLTPLPHAHWDWIGGLDTSCSKVYLDQRRFVSSRLEVIKLILTSLRMNLLLLYNYILSIIYGLK